MLLLSHLRARFLRASSTTNVIIGQMILQKSLMLLIINTTGRIYGEVKREWDKYPHKFFYSKFIIDYEYNVENKALENVPSSCQYIQKFWFIKICFQSNHLTVCRIIKMSSECYFGFIISMHQQCSFSISLLFL